MRDEVCDLPIPLVVYEQLAQRIPKNSSLIGAIFRKKKYFFRSRRANGRILGQNRKRKKYFGKSEFLFCKSEFLYLLIMQASNLLLDMWLQLVFVHKQVLDQGGHVQSSDHQKSTD